jgi:NADP-dependent 3-hydroxy acid dehydrogenase YdfG
MKSLNQKTALVSGASSGIGRACALRLAQAGANVLLLARKQTQLEEVQKMIQSSGGKAEVWSFDLRNRQDLDKNLCAISEKHPNIDILINNAGVLHLAELSDLSLEALEEMVDVNFTAALYFLRHFAGQMKKQGTGHIINISSDAALAAQAQYGVYSATKAALNMLAQTLKYELSDDAKIKMTSILPGETKTNIFKHLDADSFSTENFLEPEDVAEAMFYALNQPERVQVDEIILTPSQATYLELSYATT